MENHSCLCDVLLEKMGLKIWENMSKIKILHCSFRKKKKNVI